MILGWEQREENDIITRNASTSDILTFLTLLTFQHCRVLMRNRPLLLSVPSWTKVEIPNFSLLHFLGGSARLMNNSLCLCDVRKGRSYVNSNVSVSSIFNNGQFYLKYYFLHHRNPPALSPLKEIQLSVNCYVSVFIFHQNAKTITFLYIYRAWRNVPKPS